MAEAKGQAILERGTVSFVKIVKQLDIQILWSGKWLKKSVDLGVEELLFWYIWFSLIGLKETKMNIQSHSDSICIQCLYKLR